MYVCVCVCSSLFVTTLDIAVLYMHVQHMEDFKVSGNQNYITVKVVNCHQSDYVMIICELLPLILSLLLPVCFAVIFCISVLTRQSNKPRTS